MSKINRREALTRLGGFMALGFLGGKALADTATTKTLTSSATSALQAKTGESLSIAHITDIHITPQRDAEAWFAKCLNSIQSNPAKPKLILNTGDCVMETLTKERSEADKLWKLWRGVIQRENALPLHSCLGNHDHWALAFDGDNPKKHDPMYGKKLGLAGLGLERGYYSFDEGPWHFVALDSVFPTGKDAGAGWTGMLDDEQFHWLEKDLKATPADRPVLVYSHIPILQVCSYKVIKPQEDHSYRMSAGAMLGDARRVIDLFKRHPNVKLCLSGHLHLEDRVELSGVTYICDGSVCGAWWKGTHIDSKPGYSILNLHPDGTFDYNYKSYGWNGEHAAG